MPNSKIPEFAVLIGLRIPLFLGCRRYLLRSLYSDLQTLSSGTTGTLDVISPPATPNDVSALPAPTIHRGATSKSSSGGGESRAFSSTVARTTFSLMFAESGMLFFVLMLQGVGVFEARTRQISWQFSLSSIMTLILVGVPLCVSLIFAVGARSTATSSNYLLAPRILIALLPLNLYLYMLWKIPLPPALTLPNSRTDLFTTSLARLIVLGITILGLLSGFGAITNSWNLVPWVASKTRAEPSDAEVSSAEYALQSVRNDLRERRMVAERQAQAQTEASSMSGWLARVTPDWRGGDNGLSQELRGLEALEAQMARNTEALRARRDTARYARTLPGRIQGVGERVFAVYCILRVVSCVINVLLPWRRASSGQSQTDLIADLLARLLFLAPASNMGRDTIASAARQLSLVFVGAIILTSVRRVLCGATRALRVTSRNLAASLMMLILAQLMGIYLLSTIVQLRSAFPPPENQDASQDLFATIPEFEVFGALFDWAFLLAAAGVVAIRWGGERVFGSDDD